MIEAGPRPITIDTLEKPQAFRPEFYKGAEKQQIVDDLTSFLGEYRFKIPDYPYKMRFSEGKLLDPNTGDDMEDKAQKAIDDRISNGLNVSREVAEKEGFASINSQLSQTPDRTVVWFSPQGDKSEGYGEYGFGFVGRLNGEMLDMTAIRLENSNIDDFNNASKALWENEYDSPEDFLRNPRALDIDLSLVKEFIYGNFEIRDKKVKAVFSNAISYLSDPIDRTREIIQNGSREEIEKAINTLQNLAIDLKNKLEVPFDYKLISEDSIVPDYLQAMQNPRYFSAPPPVAGSCGMTGKIESSNILGKLLGSSESVLNKSTKEWFNCPKCTYKADGPIGNKCPGCGLTKEQYVKEGGENCD